MYKIVDQFFHFEHERLSATDRIVFLALAWHANDQGAAWPMNALLESETGLTSRAIRKSITALEGSRYVEVKSRNPRSRKVLLLEPKQWLGAVVRETYEAKYPECSSAYEERGAAYEEPDSAYAERGAAHAEPGATEHVSNRSLNTSCNPSENNLPSGEGLEEPVSYADKIKQVKNKRDLLGLLTVDLPRACIANGMTPPGPVSGGEISVASKIKRFVGPVDAEGTPGDFTVAELAELSRLYSITPVVWKGGHPAHGFLDSETLAMLRNISGPEQRSTGEDDDEWSTWG